MEKYLYNFHQAFLEMNPMFFLSLITVLTTIAVLLCILLVIFGAWVISYTGAGILFTIPILAFIRVGYAVWTGR